MKEARIMRFLRLVLVTLVPCSGALAQTPWHADEYPISYWVGPPREFNTARTWQTVKDCNFTVCGQYGGYSVADNRKMLDFCAQLGLKAMVVDGRTNWEATAADGHADLIKSLVADYGSSPALYAYFIQDEPSADIFPALAKVSQELQRQDPRHLPYINLLPTYGTPEQLGTPTYTEYLDRFLRTVKPAVLSYDHYALLDDGSDRVDYFENLGLIREYGLRYGVPPWNIILALPHLSYREPSAAEMSWQVYTSLAYGIKGLVWFTYWTLPDWDLESKGAAIVDSKGEPARLFPLVRQLNGEVRTLGKTLLQLTSTGVYHTGEVPLGCTRLGVDAPVQLPGDLPLLIGFFVEATGQQYALVVNRDHSRPVAVTLLPKPHVTALTEISASTGADTPVPLTDGTAQLSLGAGAGRLLRLTTSFAYAEPPAPLTAVSFEFSAEGDLEGWGGLNALTRPAVKNGALTLTFTGEDPFLIRRLLRLRPDQYSTVSVRMKLKDCNPEGQFFWTTSEEPEFADSRYLNFATQPDGQWHEYVIPVGEHKLWQGKSIRGIRLDPTTGGARPGTTVDIDWVRGE
jgi:hypothetical protein